MPPTIVHVNRHVIAHNRRTGKRQPPVAVRHGRAGAARYCSNLDVLDENGVWLFSFTYEPDHPLKCGAVVFCEIAPSLRLRLRGRGARAKRKSDNCTSGSCLSKPKSRQ